MFANLSTLQLVILLVVSIGIFVFLLFLLMPEKERKEGKKLKPTVSITEQATGSFLNENDRSVLVAVISEKIDRLSKELNNYTEVIKKMETANLERVKKYESDLTKLNEVLGRVESLLSRSEIDTTSSGDKEAIMKLTEKISLLEEKMAKPVAEKSEIEEMKNRLNEVVTILKTLGS